MSTGVPLWEFSRPHAPAQRGKQTRIAGALVTGVLYAGFALVAWWSLNHVPVPVRTTREITAALLPDLPRKHVLEPSFLTHLIKPRAQNLAPPVITIAPTALSASAVDTSPLLGGRTGGDSGSGVGGGPSGDCLDAAWMRAVSERVRQFFYYPPAALAVRRTGLVMVRFMVHRNGQIEKLQVSRSSGDAKLDEAALDILQKAQPLPPIPDRMHTDQVEGELPINFGVRSFSASSSTGTCGG